MREMLSLKALRVPMVQIIFLKKIYTPIYKKNDCIVTKVLIMAMSPGDGLMSDYFVMGKYSQNNLRTKGFTTNETILSFPVFRLQTFKAANQYEFVRVATYICKILERGKIVRSWP